MIFSGGALAVAGTPDARAEALAEVTTPARQKALEGYLEAIVKAVAALTVSAPSARDGGVVRTARASGDDPWRADVATVAQLHGGTVEVLSGFAAVAKHAAQGAAILADGLAGGSAAELVQTLGIREATGTVLDHLYVITPEAARQRLGI